MSGEVFLQFPEGTSDEDVAVTTVTLRALQGQVVETDEQVVSRAAANERRWRFGDRPDAPRDWQYSQR